MEQSISVYPSVIKGRVNAPPSKSICHRMIICSALAHGESIIQNVDYSADITATINAIELIGAKFSKGDGVLHVKGTGGKIGIPEKEVDCNESGSTLRFLIPLFSLCGSEVVFTGAKRLFERPLSVYEKIFKERNLSFCLEGGRLKIKGALEAGEYNVAGNVSSQFISGLMFALSCLSEQSIINIAQPFESRSYVKLTENVMKSFAVNSRWKQNSLLIEGQANYMPGSYFAEGDWSQAAALGALAAVGGQVEIAGLNRQSAQGDKEVENILTGCGALLKWNNDILSISSPDKGFLVSPGEIDLADCPDLGPVLCALLLFCEGETKIINAGRLRIKESDRISCVEKELEAFGGIISSGADYIVVKGSREELKKGGSAYSHNDHRIVMALTVLAVGAGLEVEIKAHNAISKSWPNYFNDLASIGLITGERNEAQPPF